MKLNLTTYLLVCLIEECAEVIQRTCKAIRFGMTEEWPDEQGKRNNSEMIETELADLDAVRGRLVTTFDNASRTERLPDYAYMVNQKLKKMEKYEKYARESCGTLEDSTD